MRRDLHERNRVSWNLATREHNARKRDQAGFLRDGGTTLFPEEIELVGPLEGRTLLHLQCNAGQDTLSLAQRGARVTGVDISDEAIDFARRLAADSGIAGEFERADVFDWLPAAARAGRHFDVVFSSYGAIGWLSDLGAWARGVAGVLAPGGRFVLVEFHPMAWMFNPQLRLMFDYSTRGEPVVDPEDPSGIGDYVQESGGLLAPSGFIPSQEKFFNPHESFGFNWGISDIVQALLDAGLALAQLREWPYSNGARIFEGMRELPGGRLIMPAGQPELPLMFGVVATKR